VKMVRSVGELRPHPIFGPLHQEVPSWVIGCRKFKLKLTNWGKKLVKLMAGFAYIRPVALLKFTKWMQE